MTDRQKMVKIIKENHGITRMNAAVKFGSALKGYSVIMKLVEDGIVWQKGPKGDKLHLL